MKKGFNDRPPLWLTKVWAALGVVIVSVSGFVPDAEWSDAARAAVATVGVLLLGFDSALGERFPWRGWCWLCCRFDWSAQRRPRVDRSAPLTLAARHRVLYRSVPMCDACDAERVLALDDVQGGW